MEEAAALGLKRCVVHTLTSSPQYNGKEGVVTGVLPNSRLKVMMDGDPVEKSFDRKNVQLIWARMPTAAELQAECTIICVVELPPNYNSETLDVGVGGSDRAAIVSLILSITDTENCIGSHRAGRHPREDLRIHRQVGCLHQIQPLDKVSLCVLLAPELREASSP